MGMVVTMNKITEFPQDMQNTVVGTETVMIEGLEDVAETRIYREEDPANFIEGFNKYIVRHTQKHKIQGRLWQREFKEIMRIFKMSVYTDRQNTYAYSIGTIKADYAHKAFQRLHDGTSVKCEPIDVNLFDAVEKIIRYAPDMSINSGWFSNLGLPNLNNVLLQGNTVNLGPEWQRFKQTRGASLSNIEIIIDDNDFDRGQVKVALSKRGVLFSHTNLRDKKFLEVANRIQAVLNR